MFKENLKELIVHGVKSGEEFKLLTVDYYVDRMRTFAPGPKHVVAVSGGVDSALVLMLMCEAYGPENVMAIFRDVRSDKKHEADFLELVRALGCKYRNIDANHMYDCVIDQDRIQSNLKNEPFFEEGEEPDQDEAYASLKSRITTPILGYFAKKFGGSTALIFGTGNVEEDGALRYYDKFGDGAVDWNPINGLLKTEVRQLVLYFAAKYELEVLKRIAHKIPSADLHGNGDNHNDESSLTALAKSMGYDIDVSYGNCEIRGNVGWAVDFGMITGLITGRDMNQEKVPLSSRSELIKNEALSPEQADLIIFMREMERKTRHKDFNLPGISRKELFDDGIIELAA